MASRVPTAVTKHEPLMKLALRLAQRGHGFVTPNPMVGAVLVKGGHIIGRGWHRRAGAPHAEVEAIHDARARKQSTTGATLYVTLEPCCTHGRTPPCVDAIIAAKIKEVIVGAQDPNPLHSGRGIEMLKTAKIRCVQGVMADQAARINEAFNHWIVNRTPWIIIKSAMTLDGKIATETGESKWITSERSRGFAMKLRQGADGILVGVNTIISDDPSLTARSGPSLQAPQRKVLRRFILDPRARIPLTAKVLTDEYASATTVLVSEKAAKRKVKAIARQAHVEIIPCLAPREFDLSWLARHLGANGITSLLIEGGGATVTRFLNSGIGHRLYFFYGPQIVGGSGAPKAISGNGAKNWQDIVNLKNPEWKRFGDDLILTALLP